ncbi:hypothetical protein WA026_020573 [Henosepilachna vigintioctopunctata]|uniref:Uncharacterized protein n=1 Tax=Henosepilachna vigintioctopunctata TaxID=420089 RepID=A0AAW1UUF0_9CUCU
MEMEQQVLEEACPFQNDDVAEFQYQQSSINSEGVKTENRTVNLQSQIDTEKWMITEAKNFINTQEQFNLREVTILQQNYELNKNIDTLKMKIQERERHLAESNIMAGNEEQKLVENMTLTQSTRDILDMLSKYIENFQQRVNTLQTSTINVDFEKIYESRIKNLLDKAKVIEDITLPVEEYNKCLLESEKMQNEIMENESIKISLQKEKLLVEERQHRIEDDLSGLDDKIQEKIEQIQKHSEEIERMKKETFELERNILDTQKRKNIEMQKLTLERDNLKERIASNEALYVDLAKDLEKTLLEKSNLDKEMEIFRASLDDSPEIELCVLENTSFSELETQKENLLMNNEELKEGLKILRQKESELIQLNCDEKINLLNLETSIADLQKELIDSQTLYNDEKLQMVDQEQEKIAMEKIIEENNSIMKTEKNNLEVQQQTLKEIETHLELLKSDTTKQKIEYEYQQNTVLPYLETKLEDLKKKLWETEKKVKNEQTKLEERRALKIKKIEQYNRAKRYFFMYSDTTKLGKSTESMDNETEEYETQENETEETNEKIEEEQPTDEISAKSILKSPNSSAPQTPKKNVTFTGVPDSESCSSFDTSIRGDKSGMDPLGILNLEPPSYPRSRSFD